jgi:hypothetical protein
VSTKPVTTSGAVEDDGVGVASVITGAAGGIVVLTIPPSAAAKDVGMTAVVGVVDGVGEILTLVSAKLVPG